MSKEPFERLRFSHNNSFFDVENVSKGLTILGLKELAQAKTKIPVESLKLVFRGITFDHDGYTLEEVGKQLKESTGTYPSNSPYTSPADLGLIQVVEMPKTLTKNERDDESQNKYFREMYRPIF